MSSLDVVTVGGPPGSGTTTACRLLSQRTGLEHLYVGKVFREMAAERGMSLEAFGAFVDENPEIDRQLEERQIERARRGRVILEGRVSGWAVFREGVPAFKVWIDADPDERVRRVCTREGLDAEAAARMALAREEAERRRYLAVYGFDLSDLSFYDLVLDSTRTPPETIVDRILSAPPLRHLTDVEGR